MSRRLQFRLLDALTSLESFWGALCGVTVIGFACGFLGASDADITLAASIAGGIGWLVGTLLWLMGFRVSSK